MNDHADDLIYAAASSMHSLAATLTGEAKLELSKLRKLLAETNALPREQALLLTQGVAEVREHLVLGPTLDPVGDGNRLWDVFSAAWAIRQESHAFRELDLKVLDSLSYIIECYAESCHGEAKNELIRLGRLLQTGTEDAEAWKEVREEIARIDQLYQGLEGRRCAVNALCKLNRRLWVNCLGDNA